MNVAWGIIRTANNTPVIVAPFSNYDDATAWAKYFSNERIGCKVVPLYPPSAWLDESNELIN